MEPRFYLLSGAALGLLTASGCSKKIGDACKVNTDCSLNGDRECDTSQPGGYCTVEGCDEASCPKEAVCVRFFPTRFLDPSIPGVACDPAPRDPLNTTCSADDICLPKLSSTAPATVDASPGDDAGTPPVPASFTGVCTPRATETRYCALACDTSGDCRDGYVCRDFGAGGAFMVPQDQSGKDHFCAPFESR